MSDHVKFSWKAFISFYVTFSFVVLAVSGVILYVAPPGRLANWTIWRLFLLRKAQWQSIHTVVALLFLVAAGFHVYFNWKVLVAYVRSRLHAGIRMKRELAAASILGSVVLAASIGAVPPFSAVMSFGEDIKNSWSSAATEPPVPHAELMTIESLAATVKLAAETVIANLERSGIQGAAAWKTVQQIAGENGLTPQQVYQKGLGGAAKPAAGAGGGGWGRMTVQEVGERSGVRFDDALARLRAVGLDATASTPVRDLAARAGRTPMDIAAIIAGSQAAVPGPGAHPPEGTPR
ncbi:MAG TPA: DUF4405 domain-containing protein [Vicinamibacterales bacterium]|nr:DUF4405 domain-containing protein [Vicinamibacterales bacterium]HPK71487.1 DUF4405 domain-containing protein [Vicinamibacterales bacterium]